MRLEKRVLSKNIPNHIAIILDGNGRWANKRGLPRTLGHRKGSENLKETAISCAKIGIKALSVYAFSTENWNRPKAEVEALMDLLVLSLENELETFQKNSIRLLAIGDIDSLPPKTKATLLRVLESTSNNSRMSLVLALSYSARWEITDAAKRLSADFQEGKIKVIDENIFAKYLTTNNIPDPELLIRTSGEYRLSNFLLWQLAYSEMYFTNKYWPEFRAEEFYEAIVDFQGRERRFGKTSEQIKEIN